MKEILIKQVDAFTRRPFTGNPAGVVTEAAGLTEGEMQLIAREMNLSETAYILPPTTSEADIRIRWFTPKTEVDLCGHATIASFHALCEEGEYGLGEHGTPKFKPETAVGVLPIQVENCGDGFPKIEFGLPVPKFSPTAVAEEELTRALGIKTTDLNRELPIMKDRIQLIVPIRKLSTVLAMRPDIRQVERISKGLSIGITPLTLETVDPGLKVHIRFFAPAVGVDEDPVTGSTQGPVGAYLLEQGVLDASERVISYIGEQGDAIGRPGRVFVKVTHEEGTVTGISIGGYAVTVLKGAMCL